MPIYAYRCAACGHAKDVLQKLSDAPLRECPACGAEAFTKQVTAAGFQLKGSGWYVTDFRGGAGATGKDAQGGKDDAAPDAAADTSKSAAADKPSDKVADKKPDATPVKASAPTAAPVVAKPDKSPN